MILTCKNLSVGYGGKSVADGINISVDCRIITVQMLIISVEFKNNRNILFYDLQTFCIMRTQKIEGKGISFCS